MSKKIVPFRRPKTIVSQLKNSAKPSTGLSGTEKAELLRLIDRLQVRILEDANAGRVVRQFIRGILRA